MTKNNLLYYLTYLFVISLFTYLFYLSTKYVINYWTFSQAHINYSDGFVKRGLFGTVALFLEKNLNIKFIYSFNFFFIIFYSANIILFFLILKKYIIFKFIFLFLALSPTLILFGFNDLGGYQRFDAISIFIILLHTLCVSLYRSKKINFESYKTKFKFLIFPLVGISLFIHEIQMWSIPFHFFLIYMIYKERNENLINILILFFILFILSLVVFVFPSDQESILSMYNKLSNKEDLWKVPIIAASSSKGNLDIVIIELQKNLLNLYNLKINIFFLFLSVIPINLLMYFFNIKKFILIKEKNIFLYFYLALIPYLAFFAIGDTGRWIHLVSITSFAFFSQYPVNQIAEPKDYFKINFSNIFIIIILIVYSFFIRMPHGGNYEEKNIGIWGGINKKFIALYNVYFSKKLEDDFNLNKRFKRTK